MADPALPAMLDGLLMDQPERYEALHLTELEARTVLASDVAKQIFTPDDDDKGSAPDNESYIAAITRRTNTLLAPHAADTPSFTTIASHLLYILAACHTLFLQSNVTGPVPLAPFAPAHDLIPAWRRRLHSPTTLHAQLVRELTVDGVPPYALTPHIELLAAAVGIARCEPLFTLCGMAALVARLRTRFLHQKVLREPVGTLQDAVLGDVDMVKERVLREQARREERARVCLEAAVVHVYYGLDAQARKELEMAGEETGFEYALTGRLGRRTKFQTRDISQLVVLAKSAEEGAESALRQETTSTPKAVDLDDDTLLERISFTKEGEEVLTDSEDQQEDRIKSTEKSMTVSPPTALPPSLASLDPSSQPKLAPLDSIILLTLASAITNTSPQHGLTREETLPYAVRVIEGGSSNWQVYSQALLVRSKIEGYRTRTVERGLLQLQALVDQVVADTLPAGTSAPLDSTSAAFPAAPMTFLPRADKDDSAPVEQRLAYIWFLDFKTRWDLEAELASRWVSVGGLRTALDIYERLQMWAEVALCYAATEREAQARATLRKQLFQRTAADDVEDSADAFAGPELPKDQLPPDAPRLLCILGDIENDCTHYERAWVLSGARFARAQRSIARWHLARRPADYAAAAAAYELSLQVDRLNHQAWFALGCARLELGRYREAAAAFTRTVQLEEEDAEAWSNLAAALMHLPDEEGDETQEEKQEIPTRADDEEDDNLLTPAALPDPHKHKREALAALRRAARLKYDESRIWENVLTVAASIPPPQTPFDDIITAMERIVALRAAKQGEKCIDERVLHMLVAALTATEYDAEVVKRPGSLARRITRLLDECVVPRITHSAELWLLVAQVEAWRARPGKALEAHERAWRVTVGKYTAAAFQSGDAAAWRKIVEATVRVVREGYAGLGMRVHEDVEENGESELVAKDWLFKSRSAIRSVLGKGKEFFEGSEGWGTLKELQSEVAGGN